MRYVRGESTRWKTKGVGWEGGVGRTGSGVYAGSGRPIRQRDTVAQTEKDLLIKPVLPENWQDLPTGYEQTFLVVYACWLARPADFSRQSQMPAGSLPGPWVTILAHPPTRSWNFVMPLIIENLSKTYPNGVRALDNVSLTISKGMFGLLGPNGAGKSTLMRTLATLQESDAGTAFLDDLDVLRNQDQVRKILGYLPQEFGVYPKTSARRMLDHVAMLKGVTARGERRDLVDAMLQRVNLYQHRHKAISGFSGGMKQRFGIAQALLCNPRLVIVDEPTAGLDPNERNRFYNLLAEVGEETIVILSTHIVQDVRELCSQMAIVNLGKVVYTGRPADAIDSLEGQVWERSVDKQNLAELEQQHHILSTKLVAGRPLIHVLSEGNPGPEFHPIQPELEDVFFRYIKPMPGSSLDADSSPAPTPSPV